VNTKIAQGRSREKKIHIQAKSYLYKYLRIKTELRIVRFKNGEVQKWWKNATKKRIHTSFWSPDYAVSRHKKVTRKPRRLHDGKPISIE